MSFGTTPTSTTSLGVNQFPASSVYTPGTSGGNFTALQGGPASTDGQGNASAPVATYTPDGSDVTQGSTTDAAWSGSGSGSEIAILKKLVSQLSSALSVSGSVTANAGTNLNTSLLALESGGNLASIKADLDAVNTVLGTQADAAYSGTGNGSEIALLKKIVAELASTLSISGSVTANAGTNLNTSALALESGGNLASAKTDLDAISTAVGTQADAAWAGSGAGSEIAILKKIVAALASTLAVSGTVTANAGSGTMTVGQTTGTNLHTVVDSGTVTANIGTTNGLALDTSVNGLLATQGSSTSGEKGPLVQGAVTTGAPSYTSGQTNPLSLTTAGALRIDGSGVTQPISAASLPLPTGAATSAKQPALGTAGSAASDVLSVQGIASMTPLKTDGSGVTQPISGTITANAGSGTFTVGQATGSNLHTVVDSGSITANIGTTNGLAQDSSVNGLLAVQGSTTSGEKGPLVQGAVTTSAPTYTSGQTNPLSLTPAGAMRVDGSATTQPVSGTVTVQQATAANLKVDLSGTSANATALKVDGSAVTQPVSGSVTANIGATNGLALDSSVNGILVAQGSSTSGEKGPLVQGAVTTSAPSYTSGQTSPVSLTTAGAMRVDGSAVTQPVSGTVTANAGTNLNTSALALESGGNLATLAGAISGAKVQANTAQINGVAPAMGNGVSGTGVQRVTLASDSTGQVTLAAGTALVGGVELVDSAGSNKAAISANGALSITAQASGAVSATLQSGATGNGNGTTLSVLGMATVALTVSGTFSATVNFEGTEDNTNWASIEVTPFGSASPVTTATSAGSFVGACAGMQSVRARVSGYVSGSVTVTAHAVPLSTGGSGGSGGSGGTSSSFGAAFPTIGTAIGASDGTDMQSLLVESASNKNLRVGLYSGATEASVTASNALKVDGSAVTQPVSGTVTANIGTTNGVALDSSVNGLLAVQGSSTSGEKGPLVQGAVTTSAPTYTNGQTDPLSLTTAGALRVDGSAVTQPVSGTVTANAGSGTFTVTASNLQTNLNQVAGSTVATAATGIQKVGLTDGSGTAITSTSSALDVNIKSGGGSGFSVTDEATWTAGTSAFVPTGGVYNDSATALTSGQEGTVRVTNNRGLHTNLRNSSGTEVATSSNPLRIDPTGTTTQPVSGTVTANIGTTNGLALDTSVNGLLVAQGSTTSGEKGPLVQGAVTTSAPSYTTGQSSPLSLTTAGALRIDGSGVTQPVSGTITANAGSGSFTVAQSTASNLNAQVQGVAASGATNSGNPVKVGGVFNTTQPTVTSGQAVDAQMTSRGAQLVATGVDAFDVTVNAALPAGGNTIGAVTQASGPWTQNLTEVGGASLALGQTTMSASLPVTLASNQGNVNVAVNAALPAGANTIGAVTQASGPWSENVTQIAGASIATSASGVQKVGIVGSAGATVDSTVGAGAAPTNAIIAGAVYNSSAPAPTSGQAMALQADQAGNLRTFPGIALASLAAWNSSTALNATQTIFSNSGCPAVLVQLDQTGTITAGAITFEATYDGTNWGTVPANCVLDPTSTSYAQISLPYSLQASTNKPFIVSNNGWQGLRIKLSTQISGTGTVTPFYALLACDPITAVLAYSPTAANFNVSIGAALPAGANTIGAVTQASGPWSQNVTQFGGSALVTGTGASGAGIPRVTVSNDSNILATQSGTWTVQPGNTANSTPWLINVGQFGGTNVATGTGASGSGIPRVTVSNDSQVQPIAGTAGGSTPYHAISAASTNGTNVKSSAGLLYGLSISNTSASARFFKLYDKSTAPTVGTDTPKMTIQIPGTGTVIRAFPVGLVFSSGIGFGCSTGLADADTGATGATELSFDLDYK